MPSIVLVLAAAASLAQVDAAAFGMDKPAAAVCIGQVEAPTVPGVRLLADRQAGQLIDSRAALAATNAPLRTDETAKPKALGLCNSPTSPGPQSSAITGRMASSSSPLLASQLTSGFGMRVHPILGEVRMHSGVDLAAPMGSPVFATYSGKVTSAGWAGGYGLSASVENETGLETRFGHMSRMIVSRGQSVQKGEIIGFVGSTGLSTGPHLHYEVRYKGQPVDPVPLLASRTPP